MDNCVFCKIAKGEILSYKIHENDDFLAFLDITQFAEGHTIVIPKKHFRFIWDIDNVDKFYEFAVEVANHFRSLGYEFIDSASFGRLIPHAHYHLISHKLEGSDWEKSIKGLGEMQKDVSRRLSNEEFLKVRDKFKL